MLTSAAVGPWPPRAGSWDLLVNCTPVGMYPHVDETPLDARRARRGRYVYDLVYNPPTTRLLREARARGLPDDRRPRDAGRAGAASSSSGGPATRPPAGVMREAALQAAGGVRRAMKITSFEEFKELARRGTFVPVVQGDRRRPADAGVGVPEDRRARRLRVPARERRRRRARRPLFVPRQGSVPDPARARRQDDDRARRRDDARASEPFIDTLRRLMADFRSPFVPGPAALHRRRGRLSRLRRRVVVRAGARRSRRRRRRRRRCRVHAVRHGAGVRSRAAPDPDHRQRAHHRRRGSRVALSVRLREDPVPRARARAQPVAHARRSRQRRSSVRVEPHARAVRGAGAHGEGAHRRRRHLPGRAVAALRGRRRAPIRSPSTARCAT